MTAAIALSEVIAFKPGRVQSFLDDESQGEVVLYFGQVVCHGCGLAVEVSSEAEVHSSGYCTHGCGNRITVQVDPRHLRLDDSRPRASGHGCVCGDPLCRSWEAV